MYNYRYIEPVYKLEPYYKKGGFFYKLENLSYELDRIYNLIEWYGPFYMFYPQRLRNIIDYKDYTLTCREDMEYYRKQYNKIKYPWMKPL